VSDLNRVIVALDKPDFQSALNIAEQLDPSLCRVKVGKELFTAAGPAVVDALHQLGFQIFLDLKFHDIPNTVAAACKSAASLGVWMLNVHASGGESMLKAAREALGAPGANTPLLIGVTVLTSFDSAELEKIGVADPLEHQVQRLTGLVSDAGMDGVVCSALEAASVKSLHPQLLTVTPGIRLADDQSSDQKRVMTPDEAVRRGADYLVIGRSITAAADPVARLAQIRDLIATTDTQPA
jgi:orotidine-5'-phosphate decarboxylase